MKKLTVFVLLIGAICGGAFYYTRMSRANVPLNLRTSPVERGELLIEIKSNGTLEPQDIIDVGAQVMGRIQELGPDSRAATDPAFAGRTVDYCSNVEQGALLARIDPSLYQATYDQALAAVKRAEADLLQMRAKLEQADAEWKRAQRLRELKLPSISGLGAATSQVNGTTMIKGISDSDFILAKANYDVAKATVEIGVATVAQQSATMRSAKQNLDYTTISSPVKGTIIDRRVNIGQTVVASLNAPSLFLIAKDLKRMEIWTSVNEADIGRLKVGMPVRFFVDAFPSETFKGVVRQIRLNASMTSNVVLYTVVVTVNNDDLKLLPYLTADVRFQVEKREGTLLVPNAALRYEPRAELIMEDDDDDEEESADEKAKAKKAEEKANDSKPKKMKTVWIRRGDLVSSVPVEIGVSDGQRTEILSGELTTDMEVVLGENRDEKLAEGSTNPFAPPQFGKGKGGKKKGF